MTRPTVQSGFPALQEPFPEQTRELGRHLGLEPEAVVILRWSAEEGKGTSRPAWDPEPAVDGRLDPLGSRGGGMRGGAVDESSSHIVSYRREEDISTKDRVRVEGQDWIVTAIRERTDKLIGRAEVKQVV